LSKELLGRVGTLINLATLKEDDYYKILKLGVRGLRQLIKPFFDKALFEAPTKCAMGLEYLLEL